MSKGRLPHSVSIQGLKPNSLGVILHEKRVKPETAKREIMAENALLCHSRLGQELHPTTGECSISQRLSSLNTGMTFPEALSLKCHMGVSRWGFAWLTQLWQAAWPQPAQLALQPGSCIMMDPASQVGIFNLVWVTSSLRHITSFSICGYCSSSRWRNVAFCLF